MSGRPSTACLTMAPPCSFSVSRMFVMIRIGFSGLPVAFAGHAAVHRPHSVHAYPSRSCRHESCSTRFTPNVSVFSRSIVFSAPLGVRSMKKRSEEHTSELQSPDHLVCRLLLEKKKKKKKHY